MKTQRENKFIFLTPVADIFHVLSINNFDQVLHKT